MKKTLPIIAVTAATITIGASIALAKNKSIDLLKANNTRNPSIVINKSCVTVTNEEATPYQVYFDLATTTESGFSFTSKNCNAGGNTSIYFPGSSDGETYMFYAEGPSAGGAFFAIDFALENLYSFTSVVVDGVFTHGNGSKTYRYTYTTADTDIVDWYPDEGWAFIYIRSAKMDDNYKSVQLDTITINYSCLA